MKAKKILEKILTIVGGGGVGFLNGFFGGGGGMLAVPLLNKGLKEETKVSHATAILTILPISIVSMVVYLIKGHWETQPVLITSAGVVAGGIIGALILKKMPPKITALVFSLLMIGAGIRMII
ncbi:MAG: sulfite exporter TauE/SafE family protein [Firmicutes bacterium]|nr:sulfite exporter TauE/SafE family protein [Bacillota bacterium]